MIMEKRKNKNMEWEKIFDDEIECIQKQCGSLYSIGEKEKLKKLFKKLLNIKK